MTGRRWWWLALRTTLLVLTLATVTACRETVPMTRIEMVTAVRGTFPVLVESDLHVLWTTVDCSYISYGRGAFSAEPEDLGCGVVGEPSPQILDAQARTDMARLRGELAPAGGTEFVSAQIQAGEVAGGWFQLGPCLILTYEPSYTVESMNADLEDDVRAIPIDRDWYELDLCS